MLSKHLDYIIFDPSKFVNTFFSTLRTLLKLDKLKGRAVVELYETIRILAEDAGLTVNQLCKKSGVAPSTLSELKTGHIHDLSRRNAERIATALGVNVGDLYNEYSPVEETQNELFEKRKLLFDLSGKATEEDLDMFIKILNKIIGENE